MPDHVLRLGDCDELLQGRHAIPSCRLR
jgi:hypothetical protein